MLFFCGAGNRKAVGKAVGKGKRSQKGGRGGVGVCELPGDMLLLSYPLSTVQEGSQLLFF